MLQWISDLLFGPPYRRTWVESRPFTIQLEDSVAWSSFLASGVDGVEDVSFAEFVRRSRRIEGGKSKGDGN